MKSKLCLLFTLIACFSASAQNDFNFSFNPGATHWQINTRKVYPDTTKKDLFTWKTDTIKNALPVFVYKQGDQLKVTTVADGKEVFGDKVKLEGVLQDMSLVYSADKQSDILCNPFQGMVIYTTQSNCEDKSKIPPGAQVRCESTTHYYGVPAETKK